MLFSIWEIMFQAFILSLIFSRFIFNLICVIFKNKNGKDVKICEKQNSDKVNESIVQKIIKIFIKFKYQIGFYRTKSLS